MELRCRSHENKIKKKLINRESVHITQLTSTENAGELDDFSLILVSYIGRFSTLQGA